MDPFAPVEAPDAELGRADPTRRWALAREGRADAFPGLTRVEARQAFGELPEQQTWDMCLVAISLPVLLSDGAGPYLLDVAGNLVLAVGDHPGLKGGRVAIGPLDSGDEQIGVLEPLGPARGVWQWCARALVNTEQRLTALDALDQVSDDGALQDWAQDVGGAG